MRSLALLSSAAVPSTTAATRPRALAARASTIGRRRSSSSRVAAVVAGSASGRSRFAGAPVAFARRSLRVSAKDDDESDSETSEIVDRGPPHQIFYEDAKDALALYQESGDDASLAELAAAIDSLGGAAADASSLAAAAESRAEAAEKELETAKDTLLRLRAEFDNFRKRSESEKAAVADRAKAEAVEALVPLADSFDAAATLLASAADASDSPDENSPAAKVASAYGGLQKQLLDAFRGVGVVPVPGEGSLFDPNVHEAVMRELDDSVPDGTILQEFRRGYAMGDRLVRAAMVKVSYTEGDSKAEAATAGAGAESE